MWAIFLSLFWMIRSERIAVQKRNERMCQLYHEMTADYDRAARERTEMQIAINKMMMQIHNRREET